VFYTFYSLIYNANNNANHQQTPQFMPTASSLLDTRRALGESSSKVFPVRIQIYHNGKQFKISPKDATTKEPIAATEAMYNKYKNNTCNCSTSRQLRDTINKELQKCNLIFEQLKTFSPDGFKKLYFSTSGIRRKAASTNLKELYEQKIASLIEYDKFATASNYRSSLNNILAFCKDTFKQSAEEVVLEDVTIDWLKQFERWNLKKGNNNIADLNSKNSQKKLKYHRLITAVRIGNRLGTVKCYIRCLQAIFNDAIAERLIASTAYPFGKRGYSVGGVQASKIALTEQQVLMLHNYNGKYNDAKDVWLWLYYGNGMNITDALHVKKADIFERDGNNWFYFRRKKTQFSLKESFEIQVWVSQHLQTMIDRSQQHNSPFVFDVLKESMSAEERFDAVQVFKKNINQRLRSLSKVLGFHINLKYARSTFATMLRDKGTPVAIISKLLGHSSIQTTEIYLSSLPNNTAKEAAKELENIWLSEQTKKAVIEIASLEQFVKAKQHSNKPKDVYDLEVIKEHLFPKPKIA
jgi:integrase/recombinase XerD